MYSFYVLLFVFWNVTCNLCKQHTDRHLLNSVIIFDETEQITELPCLQIGRDNHAMFATIKTNNPYIGWDLHVNQTYYANHIQSQLVVVGGYILRFYFYFNWVSNTEKLKKTKHKKIQCYKKKGGQGLSTELLPSVEMLNLTDLWEQYYNYEPTSKYSVFLFLFYTAT